MVDDMPELDSLRPIIADILRTVPPAAPETDSFWDASIWTRHQRQLGAELLTYVEQRETVDNRESEIDELEALRDRVDELEDLFDTQQKHNVKLAETNKSQADTIATLRKAVGEALGGMHLCGPADHADCQEVNSVQMARLRAIADGSFS